MNKPTLRPPNAEKPLRERASCGTCMFAGPHESTDAWRYCRASSPDYSRMNGRAIWPTTDHKDWCGDYRAEQ